MIMANEKQFEVDVKRFYVPCDEKINCVECGHEMPILKNYEYLSYPTANKPEKKYLYCSECECEMEVNLTVNISLSVDKSSIVKI